MSGSSRAQQVKKGVFLTAYAETGNVSEACRRAEIERSTHYRWLEADPEYAVRYKQAEDQAIDQLEAEARRRAFEGWEEPVVSAGKLVTNVRKYSDTLLIFLLKGYRSRFRDRVEVTVDLTRAAEDIAKEYGLDAQELVAEAEAILKAQRGKA